MRVALIAPEKSPSVPNALAGHFRKRGHDVRVIEWRDHDPEAALRLAELVEKPDDLDLVHSFAGHEALLQLGLMHGPVVATISQETVARAPAVFRHYHERFHFVAGDASAPQGVRLEARIASDDSEACASAYEELYTTIITAASTIARRPWGYYVVLADEPDHKVKRIVVYPGKRLSLQKHKRRAEHWFVLSGEALVTRDEEERRVSAGRCIEIPIGAWHRVQNPATSDLAFIEVQTGDYFGEDDIERREDDFGRA